MNVVIFQLATLDDQSAGVLNPVTSEVVGAFSQDIFGGVDGQQSTEALLCPLVTTEKLPGRHQTYKNIITVGIIWIIYYYLPIYSVYIYISL